MCGLMFMAGAVPGNVQQAAWAGAARRGPHSNGVAVWHPDGWITARSAGRLDPVPMTGAWPHQVIVAHSRLATSSARPGDMPDPEEGQPLIDGHCLVAHNGTLPDVTGYCAEPPAVDSQELLCALSAGHWPNQLIAAPATPQALIWSPGDDVFAYRVDGADGTPAHPLYRAAGDGWCAVSSGPLPGGRLLSTDKTHTLWSAE